MEQKFFICTHCGNIAAADESSGVPIKCLCFPVRPSDEVECAYAYCNLRRLRKS